MRSEEMKKWAEKNQKFIKLSDGQVFVGWLKEAKPTISRFDPEKEVIRYTFTDADGNEKFFENGSPRLCEELSEYVGGGKVTIFREGDGPKTRYVVGDAE